MRKPGRLLTARATDRVIPTQNGSYPVKAPREATSAPRARPELRLASAADDAEWLRDTAGTGELADLRTVHDRFLVVAGDHYRRHLTAAPLAALVQSRYRVLDDKGRPRLFALAAARLAVARPAELPSVQDWFEDAR